MLGCTTLSTLTSFHNKIFVYFHEQRWTPVEHFSRSEIQYGMSALTISTRSVDEIFVYNALESLICIGT